MTLEDIRFLASNIRDGQRDAANQIIAALRDSNRNFSAPESEATEPRPSKFRRNLAPKDRGIKPRSPYENELSVSHLFRELQLLIYSQRKIRTHLAEQLMPSNQSLENAVTAKDIDNFDPETEECCTPDTFRIHLAGTPGDTWNKSATRVFVNSFLAAHKDYEATNNVVRAMVMKKCTAVVGSAIRRYKSRKVHRTKASRDLERRNKNCAERKRTVRGMSLHL